MFVARYKQDEDGYYRLQTIRYESIELNQETVNEGEEDEEAVDSPAASTYPSSPASLSTQSSQLTPVQQNVNRTCTLLFITKPLQVMALSSSVLVSFSALDAFFYPRKIDAKCALFL